MYVCMHTHTHTYTHTHTHTTHTTHTNMHTTHMRKNRKAKPAQGIQPWIADFMHAFTLYILNSTDACRLAHASHTHAQQTTAEMSQRVQDLQKQMETDSVRNERVVRRIQVR
jgi:hypothetical protein